MSKKNETKPMKKAETIADECGLDLEQHPDDCDPIPDRAPDLVDAATRFLVIPFGPEELQEVAADMAKALRAARDSESAKSAKVATYNGEIKKAMENARRLADDYERGGKHGDVKTALSYYYEEDLVVEVREDTGEVLESRALRADERQMGLKSIDGGEPETDDKGGELVAFPGDDGATPPSRPGVPS